MPPLPSPTLDSDTLKDGDALSSAVAELFDQDPHQRRHRRRIIRLQNRLRALVNEDAWLVYLRLEEAAAVRLDESIDLVAVWAFKQGRRYRRRR